MKRLLTICMVLLTTVTLSGCFGKTEDVELHIIVPQGDSYIAQLYMQYTEPNIGDNVDYFIDVVPDLSYIEEAFTNESHDIIFAPITLGALKYLDDAPYKYAATIVQGNFSLLTQASEEFDLEDLEAAEIIAYGEDSTPGLVLEVLIADLDLDNPPTINYVASASDAITAWESDRTAFVLVDDYHKFIAMSDQENIQSLDLSDEWEAMSGDATFPSIGIFVKTGTNKDAVNAYLREILISVQELYEETDFVIDMLEEMMELNELDIDYDVDAVLATLATNNIVYITADDSKTEFVHLFGYLKGYDPELLGQKYPDKNYYYEE